VSEAATVADLFRRTAARAPDQPFLAVLPETAGAYGIEPGEIAYGAFTAKVEVLARAYRAAGYGPGHRVALLLENRPAFFRHWFALNAVGAGVVPINPDLRSAELEYILDHSEAILAVAVPSRIADLMRAASAAGRTLPVIEPEEPPPPCPVPPASPGSDPGRQECALLYTSGTTGRPKGCVLLNEYFLEAGRWYATVGGLCSLRGGEERMLTPLPVFHMNAMAYSAMATVRTGGCLILLDRFHPKSWWESVRAARATIVHYLGVMPPMLMAAPPSELDRAHAVRFGFGAGVDRGLHAAFEERFGFPLIEAWAMTETGAGAVIAASHEPRHVGTSCFGRPAPAVETRLVREDGTEAAVDEPGELWVRRAGPEPRRGFLERYLKDEAATREAWEQGWFHTGDVVRRGPDGSLHFVDRRKNVIRRSGENISAVEVEGVLMQHPGVRAVAVAAAPDPVRGDEVMACIVPAEPVGDGAARERLAREIVGWCLTRLAYYKAPGWVAFVEALPLTSTQKIQRGELKALALRLLEEPGTVDARSLKKRAAA
jgi:acyl-CoA synthetase (AMP-forming)/AMP-acid ligase II